MAGPLLQRFQRPIARFSAGESGQYNAQKRVTETVMKVRPLNDRVLIQRVAEETKTSGGLFIPDSAKEKPQRGRVIAVGKGRRDDDGKFVALDVQAEDEILFGKYAGTEIKLDGEEHIILKEDEILAVIEG
jgi:chaperonin GroES